MKEYVLHEETKIKKEAYAEIDLRKLRNNLKIIKGFIGKGVKIGAVVKADAYGHGAAQIMIELIEEGSVYMAITGNADEAVALHHSVFGLPILILGRTLIENIQLLYRKYEFIYSAYDLHFLKNLENLGEKYNQSFNVHIRIDLANVGMGFDYNSFPVVWKRIQKMKYVIVKGIYAHIYSAYSFNKEVILKELNEFSTMISLLPKEEREKLVIHVEGSALLFEYPEYHFDMVRVGTALYGLPCNPYKAFGLEMILSLKAKVISIQYIQQFQSVSYIHEKNRKREESENEDWIKVIQIPFGYWDWPMLMTNKNLHVWINGSVCPLKEEACMDHAYIQIDEDKPVSVGDEVILLGDEPGVRIRDIVKQLNIELIHSEWVCVLSNRLPKKYILS